MVQPKKVFLFKFYTLIITVGLSEAVKTHKYTSKPQNGRYYANSLVTLHELVASYFIVS